MTSFKFDKNNVANAIINTVVLIVETVVALIFSLTGRRESVPKFKIEGKNKTLVTVSALFVIGICLLSLLFTLSDGPPKDDYTAQHALGTGMAEETCKLLDNKGQIVVV